MTNFAQGMSKSDYLSRLHVVDWLWRPLYARLWWSAIPLYWSGMAASWRLEWLSTFYDSAFAGFVNIFFFPPIVALILLYGFFKTRLAAAQFDFAECSEESSGTVHMRYVSPHVRGEFDPLNPSSGDHWIGSPLNPLHPFYVIRQRHSS